MYGENVLEHYRNPRNQGVVDAPDVDATESNPLCGDEIRLTLRLERGVVAEARFEGRGCAISLASASLLTERVKGRPLREAAALTTTDVVAMLGVPVSPVRLRCASLPLETLHRGLAHVGGGAESHRHGGTP